MKSSAERQLANKFLEDLTKKNYRFKIIKKKYSNNKIKNLLNFRYMTPFVGIFFCWKYFLQSKRVGYINYLPFWNFLIFLLLPPKTLLGPITGGAKYSSRHKLNFLMRKYLFTLFYKISECFLLLRSSEIIFSTDLLK